MTAEEQQLTPGMRIKNYVLEEQLGKGASGEVWKANDGTKTVALKLMNPQLLTSRNVSKHLTRLQREIEALGRLQAHPNIPSIFDYDLQYERPYLAMQYIGGESYDRLIKSGELLRIPLPRRLRIIREIAMAIFAAHNEDIIHRDIKPANVSGTENPYLLDFSVALPEEELAKTQANIGTKLYMPWDGIPDKLGDIYSFGLLAYEILFGRHAIFRPEDGQMLRSTPFMPQIVAADRIKARQWLVPSKVAVEELPADLIGKDLRPLDEVFQKVLGDRQHRYTDPRVFAEDLRRAIDEGAYPQESAAPAPPAAAPEPAPVPPPQPEPLPAAPPPDEVDETEATAVEAILPVQPSAPPAHLDDYAPTVVEPVSVPPAPPTAPVSAVEDLSGGETVLDDPRAAPVTPAAPPAPVRPAAPPIDLEPPRRSPPPPYIPPEPTPPTQLEADAGPPRRQGRSPLIYVVGLVAAVVVIGAALVLLSGGQGGETTVETLTPGDTAAVTEQTPTLIPTTVEPSPAPPTEIPATAVAVVATEIPSATPIPPTATRQPTDTATPVPPTETSIPPTATLVPPTETDTLEPPTATPVPPTSTATPLPTETPSETPIPPSETPEPTSTPSETATPIPPTATRIPTETETPEPPTVTPLPSETPSNTPEPQTETPEPTAAPSETETPIPPTSTRVPSETPTPIPPTATRIPTETETPEPPTATPLPTEAPSNTPEPPTVTLEPTLEPTAAPSETLTPIPPTSTRVPSETPTPIPPTATRIPTETPTSAESPIPVTEAATAIPPTATRVGAMETTAEPTLTETPEAAGTEEPLSADLVENIELLRAAITGDTYQCSVFNRVYSHLETRLEGDFEDNAEYEQWGAIILSEMRSIYRGFCENAVSDDQRLPRRYENDNSDLDVLLEDILFVLEAARQNE
jgi:serine/threonine protein kinase